MRTCSHSLCNAPLNMVEEDKESAAMGSLGLVDTRRMELSIPPTVTLVRRCAYLGSPYVFTDVLPIFVPLEELCDCVT